METGAANSAFNSVLKAFTDDALPVSVSDLFQRELSERLMRVGAGG